MIDTYLIDKYILKNNEHYENENKNRDNTNTRNIINIIHLIILVLSVYLYYDCNKKINAEIILTIFFPYSYIIYNFAIALNNKQGFSMQNMDFEGTKLLIDLLQKRFPENLGNLHILNAPFIFVSIALSV